MKRIKITRLSDDFHACIEGHPEIWGCGKDIATAIGDLILAHPEKFEIEIIAP